MGRLSRFTVMLVSLVLLASLVGCGKTDSSVSPPGQSAVEKIDEGEGSEKLTGGVENEDASTETKDSGELTSQNDRSEQPLLAGGKVQLVHVPEGGLQPQAAVDESGVLHLVYYKGDPLRGDLFYVRREPQGDHFSEPIRVNSQPGSAVAIGTIRGAQLALGPNGRVHVAWNGSSKAKPPGPSNSAPMLYTRSNDAGDGFEPQRNVCQHAYGLDGGGSVAADREGNVYVTWHASAGARNEEGRRVWVAVSTDEGETFAPERIAYQEPTGACGCCGMRAFADAQGTLYMLYRSATEGVHRDMMLLSQAEGPSTVQGTMVGAWETNACPMSSASFAEGPSRVWAAWETKNQIFFASVDPTTFEISPSLSVPGSEALRKHPSLAANPEGEVLLVWAEATDLEKGGTVAWQVFSADGRPTDSVGRAEGVPVWSFASAAVNPNGDFLIVY